jgi:replicative DNA helicase
VLDKIALTLRPQHFYHPIHRDIYQVCLELYTRNQPVDTVTVGAALDLTGNIQYYGGRTFLAILQQGSGMASNIEAYSNIIIETSKKRRAVEIARNAILRGTGSATTADELIDQTIKGLFDLALDTSNSNIERIGEREVGTFLEALQATERPGRLPYPWPSLDKLLRGLRPSEMTVICGRPGMAKTSMGVNIALHLAMECNVAVGIFSLEMSKQNLVNRMISQLAKIDSSRLRDADIDTDEVTRVLEVSIPLAESPLYIDDDPSLDETNLVIKARKMRWQGKIQCIVLDYIQLMRGSGKMNREQEVSSFSQTARRVARELEIPIVVLAQLNRGPEFREDHRPLLSDLRESGALEQEADVVLGLYRDHYYNPSANASDAEVIVLKHRNGETGTVHLGFNKKLTTFWSKD